MLISYLRNTSIQNYPDIRLIAIYNLCNHYDGQFTEVSIIVEKNMHEQIEYRTGLSQQLIINVD